MRIFPTYIRTWVEEWTLCIKHMERNTSWQCERGCGMPWWHSGSKAAVRHTSFPSCFHASWFRLLACFSAVIANDMLGIGSELFSTGAAHMFIIKNVFAFSLQRTADTDSAWLWIRSWKRRRTGRWSERKLVRSRTLVWEFGSFVSLCELFHLA